MNRYGKQAMEHWSQVAPQRYSEIPDPIQFFSALGDQVQERILDLAQELTEPDQPGEDSAHKAGRINNARNRAQEIVLAEMVWIEPEPGADSDPDEDQPLPADQTYLATLRQLADQEQAELDSHAS